jgi:hypothetical protein
MKKSFTFILFLAFSMLAFTQQTNQDVVYFKNGSIIRGRIIEQVPNVSIKIETSDRNLFVYKTDEIEKMTQEPLMNANSSSVGSSGMTKGYCGIINVGYGFGLGESNKGLSTINLDFINGFQLFPYFSVGLGTGVKAWFFKDYTTKPILIPAFVDLRGHFLNGNISPFLGIDLGYCWEVSPITQGLGLLFNPTLGVSFKVGTKSRINAGTGYSMQRFKKADHTVSTWNFIFGVSF